MEHPTDYMKMIGDRRTDPPQIITEGDLRDHAVAIILLEGKDGDEVLFEIRSDTIKSQPGDVCLPGGSIEEGETPAEAVVREVCEELLVTPDQVQVIGPGDVFISDSIRIHTYLCTLKGYKDTFSPDENAGVFRVPLAFFRETKPDAYEVSWRPEPGEDFPYEKICGGRDYRWRRRRSRILFYEFEERVIWGITARIMESFAGRFTGRES